LNDIPISTGDYSIIIIPDTQIVTRYHPEMLLPMTSWIVSQAERLNLKMVLHIGDVVDEGATNELQFQQTFAALQVIDQADIPLLICPGNHDYDNLLDQDRSLTMFNTYFGMERYKAKKWFGGVFEQGKVENSYAKLEINNQKYLFLSLEFGPRDEVLFWVDQILVEHAAYEVIIITHSYMYINGQRTKPGDTYNPKLYLGAEGANDGEDLWQKCFRKHANISAIYSGHHVPEHVSSRTDLGDHNNLVFQSFQNWQEAKHGGEGRIRIAVHRMIEQKVDHYVFNPISASYETNPGYEVRYSKQMRTSGM
jgi:hypothetical protein